MDVEGEGDEAVFARMFAKHMTRWEARERERKARQLLSNSERAVGDRRIEDTE